MGSNPTAGIELTDSRVVGTSCGGTFRGRSRLPRLTRGDAARSPSTPGSEAVRTLGWMILLRETGIISRKSEEMKLASIETVEIDQGVLGRILGYGNIHVSGRGISDVILHSVNDPMAVKRAIESVSNPVS